MTWKSTVFVSGAGLLATWLASVPSPAPERKATPSAAQSTSGPPAVSSEIQELASRLEHGNRTDGSYDHPSRNLFRFSSVRTAARPALVAVTPAIEIAPEPAGPALRLSGVAMDRVGEREVWTAILSAPTGVVLAHEGEEVAPGWKVSTIEAERVGLVRPDGSTLTLPLSGK